MADIYIRDIPDDIKLRLNKEAKSHNMSLNQYAKLILKNHAMHPEMRNLEDRYANLTNNVVSLFRNIHTQMSEKLEENTHVLNQVADILERKGGE